ncbi:hypothetical protein HYX17_02610 [Candidatus Woesearchaeota archaeon]|nr:hypothetical protein [Candidatus Woesearchaeota archaeon]
MTIRTLVKNKEQYLMTLPKALVESFGWQHKDKIEIKAGEKLSLILKKK